MLPPKCAFFQLHTVRGVVKCKRFSALCRYVHDTAESDSRTLTVTSSCVCVCVCALVPSCSPRHLHAACATQACTPRFCFWFLLLVFIHTPAASITHANDVWDVDCSPSLHSRLHPYKKFTYGAGRKSRRSPRCPARRRSQRKR